MTRPHPRELVGDACARIGEVEVARWCADLMVGRPAGRDSPPIEWLGGTGAEEHRYWYRTWGARGLLYAWDPAVASDVVSALSDEHWRVREMAAKVVRARNLTNAADDLVCVLTDPVQRVRTAALRALGAVGDEAHLQAVAGAQDDTAPGVRRHAEAAIRHLTAGANSNVAGQDTM